MNRILDRVNVPADLKGLSEDELVELSAEIRALIIDTVSRTGGHLAANLGVVELTVALLRIFDPPADQIVWDTGHQTYTYKILTERKDRFGTLRQRHGLSGFLKRDESKYDAFGAGHAGTALSAALGIAAARDRKGGSEHVVAVLGDGSAGCGISFEALNNLAETTRRMVVVLNDNEMSIAANVGALARYLGGLLTSPRYNRWKRSMENVAQRLHMGFFRKMYYRTEEAIKSLFLGSVLFEEFGLRYIGPVDGHDIPGLIDALSIARDSDRPILLHVSTRKGEGYTFAEQHPEKWHGTSAFDIGTGETVAVGSRPSYSSAFGRVLERFAEQDDRVIAITAGMAKGTGLSTFAQRFPDRFHDVGISEEHGAIFAAGLATQGMLPFFAVYSTFAQRVVDCLVHDICLQHLPVVLCLDRAGTVGDDGPTHHGVFDIPLFRPIPGLVIMQPRDEAELAAMMETARQLGGPAVIRYPRGESPGAEVPANPAALEIGRAEVVREGEQVQIWALGDYVPLAGQTADILAARGLKTGVVNARFVRPLDRELLAAQCKTAGIVVSMENGVVTGGFGDALGDALARDGFRGRVLKIGWPDDFIPQGRVADLMQEYGLTPEAVADRVTTVLGTGPAS